MRLRLGERVSAAESERLRLVAKLAAGVRTPVWLVGGAVRDALLGRATRDLDLVVEGNPQPLAEALAAATSGKLTAHERFGTFVIEAGEYHFDLATARRERYLQPGALPVVEPATLAEDLRRRDFTFNALALRLDDEGETLYDPLGGRADLKARLLRGLHAQTFVDDPTRLLRAARYTARFTCVLEAKTEQWLREAVAAGALHTVTGPRLWLELERLLGEATAPSALALLREWGGFAALGLQPGTAGEWAELYRTPPLPVSPADRAVAALALLALDPVALGAHYALPAAQRQALVQAAEASAQPPPCVFAAAPKSSTLYEALHELPPAALLAIWCRQAAARPALQRYLSLRELPPAINGHDLCALGLAPSPGFAVALRAGWEAYLDRNADREEQLAAAREALEQWERATER